MTLTEAAYWTRRFGVLGMGGFLLIMCGLTAFFVFRDKDGIVTNILTPDFACTVTKEEFLEERLIIPSLQLATASSELIIIDTQTGQSDRLPPIANVYEFEHSNPSLIAQEKAKSISRKLGFNPEEIRRRGTIEYYWEQDKYGRRLSINANTLNFKFDTNFNSPLALPENQTLPSEEDAKQIAISFMRGNGWLLDDYTENSPLVTAINIEPDGSFSMAQSRAEAELYRVDFYRAKPFIMFRSDLIDADQIKKKLEADYFDYDSDIRTIRISTGEIEVNTFMAEVVHQDTQKSNISVYVGPKYKKKTEISSPDEIYGIDYTSWVLNEEPCGTYPLLSATSIENQIKNDEASLVYLNDVNGDTVTPYNPTKVTNLTVKEITLAYFDTPEHQRFLQPIYIVSGDATLGEGKPGRFYFYIPAINYEALQDPTSEPEPI